MHVSVRSGFQTKIYINFSPLSCMMGWMPHEFYNFSFDIRNNIRRTLRIMKLVTSTEKYLSLPLYYIHDMCDFYMLIHFVLHIY